MNDQTKPDDVPDPWIIPLHGIAAPGKDLPPKPDPAADEEAVTAHFYDDEELPTLEFRPRLRRSA